MCRDVHNLCPCSLKHSIRASSCFHNLQIILVRVQLIFSQTIDAGRKTLLVVALFTCSSQALRKEGSTRLAGGVDRLEVSQHAAVKRQGAATESTNATAVKSSADDGAAQAAVSYGDL